MTARVTVHETGEFAHRGAVPAERGRRRGVAGRVRLGAGAETGGRAAFPAGVSGTRSPGELVASRGWSPAGVGRRRVGRRRGWSPAGVDRRPGWSPPGWSPAGVGGRRRAEVARRAPGARPSATCIRGVLFDADARVHGRQNGEPRMCVFGEDNGPSASRMGVSGWSRSGKRAFDALRLSDRAVGPFSSTQARECT